MIPKKEFYYNKFCELVKKNNGIVISKLEEYQNAHEKLIIKCMNNHIFSITLSNLKKNRWCPECKYCKMERYTKACLESITGKKFIKIRPNWLKNKNNNCLELDMYNEELKLAIEYNGIQHYKFSKYFHKTYAEFEKRLEDDKIKIILCKEKNINLLIVSYTIKNVEEYIENELTKLQINIISKILRNKIEVINEYKETIKKIVDEKNGKLLTENFILQTDTIQLECENKHIFDTKVKYILIGRWCNSCRNREVPENIRIKIAENLKNFCNTDKGKKLKIDSHVKRSETMNIRRQEIRESIKYKKYKNCRGPCKKENLTINSFNKKSDTVDGYQPYCKVCINNIKKEIRIKNSSKI